MVLSVCHQEIHKQDVLLFVFLCHSDNTDYVLLPQGSLMTPVGLHYTAGGEAYSAVLGIESVETTLRLSAAQGTEILYLLVWEMDFKTHNTTNSTANAKSVLIYITFSWL